MAVEKETLTVGLELGEALLVNGVDAGAERRAAIRAANTARQAQEAHRATRKGQDRATEARRARSAQQPAQPLKRRREPSAVHPDGLARLLEALS